MAKTGLARPTAATRVAFGIPSSIVGGMVARAYAWPRLGARPRYRPREKVPKNTYLENPILTLPSYDCVAGLASARGARRTTIHFFNFLWGF